MRCPRCGANSPEGAAVCKKCDEILDPSQFDSPDDGGEETRDEDRTDVGPAPTAVQAAQAARARATGKAASAARTGPASAGKLATPARKPLRPEPESGARRPYLADAPGERPPDPLQEAARSVDELGAFFRSLTIADRVTAGASLLMLGLLMLPWRWTKVDDDESIGLIAAFPATLLALGIAVLVYVRARRANAALAANLQLVQAFGALVMTGFCAWFLRNASEERILTGTGRAIVSVIAAPLWPAYLGTACALVALFASVANALGRRT